jgi:hypothetical protein
MVDGISTSGRSLPRAAARGIRAFSASQEAFMSKNGEFRKIASIVPTSRRASA